VSDAVDEAAAPSTDRRCRGCGAPAERLHEVVDFGSHPHASSFPSPDEVAGGEPRWPLLVVVCEACWLVQLSGEVPEEPVAPGPAPWTTADSLGRQARSLVEASIGTLAGPPEEIDVVEVASHGNYLQPLFRETDRRAVIIERSAALEQGARAVGLDVIAGDLANDGDLPRLAGRVKLLVDHYALAHHPRPDEAMAGIARLLGPRGEAVFEFDSLLPSLERGEFDGFRHGHFSYLSLTAMAGLLARHDLVPVDATTHPVYGGVLRLTVARRADGATRGETVTVLLAEEQRAGLGRVATYGRFDQAVRTTCAELRRLIDREERAGGRVVAYGAPSRGNTLLNACGIGPDRIGFTVDRSVWKQGRLLPGSGVPIRPPAALMEAPSLVLILTWDIADEIAEQLSVGPWPPFKLAVPFPEVGLVGPRPVDPAPAV
jgi:C-methyltransferase C-terminal domain/Putative zinc binding domain